MVQTLGSCLGISKKNEVLLMTIISICYNIFDMSLFQLGSNMEQIWNVNIDKDLFSETAQHNLKSFISLIVIIRSFTLHLYTTLSVALLWPAIYADRPGICIPWLAISGIKNLGTSLMSCAAGIFICASYGGYRPACLIFSLTQVWDIVPSLYMWAVVLSFYRDMKKPRSVDVTLAEKIEEMEMLLAVKRRKVRSLTAEAILRKQIENRRKFTGTSALGLEDFCKASSFENCDKGSRSLDSLLEGIANEADCMEADSSSGSFAETQIELEEGLTPSQKTMRLLGITESQINLAKLERMTPKSDLPRINTRKKCMYISNLAEICKCTNRTNFLKSDYNAKINPKPVSKSSACAANIKPIRPVKSELKSSKELANMKNPVDFLNSIPEREVRTISIHSLLPPQEITPSVSNNENFDQKRHQENENENQNDNDQPQEPEVQPVHEENLGLKKKSHHAIHKSRLPKRIFKIPKSFKMESLNNIKGKEDAFRISHIVKKLRKNNDLKQGLNNSKICEAAKQNPKIGTVLKNFLQPFENCEPEEGKMHFIKKEEEEMLYDNKTERNCASSNESIYDLDKNLDQNMTNYDINTTYLSKTSSVLPQPSISSAFDFQVKESSEWSMTSTKKFRRIKNLFGQKCYSEQILECDKIKPNQLPILVEIKDSIPNHLKPKKSQIGSKESFKKLKKFRNSDLEVSNKESGAIKPPNLDKPPKIFRSLKDLPNKYNRDRDNDSFNPSVKTMPNFPQNQQKSNDTSENSFIQSDITSVSVKNSLFEINKEAKGSSNNTCNSIIGSNGQSENDSKPIINESPNNLEKSLTNPDDFSDQLETGLDNTKRLSKSLENKLGREKNSKNDSKVDMIKPKEYRRSEEKINLAKEKLERMKTIGKRFTFFSTKHGRKNLEELGMSRRTPKGRETLDSTNSRKTDHFQKNYGSGNQNIIFPKEPTQSRTSTPKSEKKKSVLETKFDSVKTVSRDQSDRTIIFNPTWDQNLDEKQFPYGENSGLDHEGYSYIVGHVVQEPIKDFPSLDPEMGSCNFECASLEENEAGKNLEEISPKRKLVSPLEVKLTSQLLDCEEKGGGEIMKKASINIFEPTEELTYKPEESSPIEPENFYPNTPTSNRSNFSEINSGKLSFSEQEPISSFFGSPTLSPTITRSKISMTYSPKRSFPKIDSPMADFSFENPEKQEEYTQSSLKGSRENSRKSKRILEQLLDELGPMKDSESINQSEILIDPEYCRISNQSEKSFEDNTSENLEAKDSMSRLRNDVEFATNKLVTKIKDQTIRTLCSKLLMAISNCEELKCSNTDINKLMEAKGSDKEIVQKTFSRNYIKDNVLSQEILTKLSSPNLLPKNKVLTKEKISDRISRTSFNWKYPSPLTVVRPKSPNTSEFGCQASTLSRQILNYPPDEMTKRLRKSDFSMKKDRTITLQHPGSAGPNASRDEELEELEENVDENLNQSKQILKDLEENVMIGSESPAKRIHSTYFRPVNKKPLDQKASTPRMGKSRSPQRKAHNKEDLVIITAYASELGYNYRENSASRKKRLKSWTAT